MGLLEIKDQKERKGWEGNKNGEGHIQSSQQGDCHQEEDRKHVVFSLSAWICY